MITNKILVDTDCGPDDFLALAYLFAKPEVEVVGISIVHGMSDFEYALKNIKNFLALIDRLQVPIFMGFEASETPNCSFPLSWKEQSNQLKGVALSNSMHDFSLYPLSSIQYLEFTDLLAIGPLTNINYLNKHNLICPMTRIYIMGGAFEVKGNLFTTSNFVSPNDKAEWNIFADSVSAKELMATIKNKTYIVPLDVTNQVPINYTFFENFKNLKSSKELHRFATQIFENSTNFIQSGEFFAWDPLAALSITVPELLEFTKVRVDVDTDLDLGKTTCTDDDDSPIHVAFKVNTSKFYKQFIYPFQ